MLDFDTSKWWSPADVCPYLRPKGWSLAVVCPYLRLKCKLMIRLLLGYIVRINYNNESRCMCDSLPESDSVLHFFKYVFSHRDEGERA